MQEERSRQRQDKLGSQPAQQDEDFWEKLGSGNSTPNPLTSPPPYPASADHATHAISNPITKPWTALDTRPKRPAQPAATDHDLLSGLIAAPNDAETGEQKITLEDNTYGFSETLPYIPGRSNTTVADDDDDDPFGLGSMIRPRRPSHPISKETSNADEDILGLLGRPVSEVLASNEPMVPATDKAESRGVSSKDQALAELVDMGFDVGKSREALSTTDSGVDVQSAVGWLLQQAHHESTSRSRAGGGRNDRSQSQRAQPSPTRQPSSTGEAAQPAWMRDSSQSRPHQQRQSSRSPVNGEKDPSKIAAELGNNLFKTANSIWKTGTKKLNQAVADLNSDSDSSQPKWMREPRLDKGKPTTRTQTPQDRVVDDHQASVGPQRPTTRHVPEVTDEALMLESTNARPLPRKPSRPKPEPDLTASHRESSSLPLSSNRQDHSPPRFLQQPGHQRREESKGRLNRLAVEEQIAEAYISPARRKKATPKPAAPEPDLLFGASETSSIASVPPRNSTSSPRSPIRQPTRAPQTPSQRPPTLKRTLPPISPSALRSSHTSRQAGTVSFKRGDYSEAAAHYSSALAPLPPTHPLSIPLLTNRALCHLKTGDPKNCIADSNTALDLVGPSRGVGETVDLGDEGAKDMFIYWGKAMTRRAEALEQLERWADAGAVWKSCVEAGVGGATSIAGRNRCEKIMKAPSQVSTASKPAIARKPPMPKSKPKPISALDDLSGTTTSISAAAGTDSAEAVTRLRAANLEAERLDDEKFALSDKVSERVASWRSGKEGNLRALLASLDSVLWEGCGWKKVGMGELILANKVKVVYMKGIGKVHPDKVWFSFSFFGLGFSAA